MKRTRITDINSLGIPACFDSFLMGAEVYDSSCSADARVYFLDKEGGYYLKTAPKGSLKKEADMTAFFAKSSMAAQVLDYESAEADWLLSARVKGEDCTFAPYLANPEKLCDTLAETMRALHTTDGTGCPEPDYTARYFRTVEANYRAGIFDSGETVRRYGIRTARHAFDEVVRLGGSLKNDTLIHGDFCLPNIMLDDWRFSGFIDLDHAGMGDRHIDIYWALWSLEYNLKTDRYSDRFKDAYGRQLIDEEKLRLVALCEAFG